MVCASGPNGGRHVWLALTEGVDPELVASLARITKRLCPRLDTAPLTNATTGCVRPPGAPHRSGGTSVVITGDVAALITPATTPGQLTALTAAVIAAAPPAPPTPAETAASAGAIAVDERGHPYLPGERRALPARSAAALETTPTGGVSEALWSVLLGAAAARWHHSDVAAHLTTAPGLEHARSARAGRTRTPRSSRAGAAVLAHQWARAVRHVATSGRQVGDDPTFDARAGHLAAIVRDLQARAHVCPGRWERGTGPAQRRVLDALCAYALRAVRADVEADIRRLALDVGIGRESARTALLALAADGWIARTHEATGVTAAQWTITPPVVIPRSSQDHRPQADSRPSTTPTSPPILSIEGLGIAERAAALAQITDRITAYAHDAFTHQGLGIAAGNTYASIPTTEPESTSAPASSASARGLAALASAGLICGGPIAWTRAPLERRDVVAATYTGASGLLERRERAYRLERAAWVLWQDELARMKAPMRTSPARQPGPGQRSLLPGHGDDLVRLIHPRGADGRADFPAARALVTARDEQQTRHRLAA